MPSVHVAGGRIVANPRSLPLSEVVEKVTTLAAFTRLPLTGVSGLPTGSTADGLVVSKFIVQRLFCDGEFKYPGTAWQGRFLWR